MNISAEGISVDTFEDGTTTINFANDTNNKVKIEANAGGEDREGIVALGDRVRGGNASTNIKDKYGKDITKDSIKNYVNFISNSSDDSEGPAVFWRRDTQIQKWNGLWNQ